MQLLKQILTSTALAAVLSLSAASAQTPPATPKTTTTPTPKTTTAKPTAADIADAKTKGLVGAGEQVYHLADSKFYGNTSKGKFMTTADAQKAGFKQAQDNPTGKKKAAPTATTPAAK